MALFENMEEFESKGKKGDWCFLNNDTLIALQFGDDHFKETVILPIAVTEHSPKPWSWNGSKDAPTLSPSILVHPNAGWSAGWHGFLRDGILEDA